MDDPALRPLAVERARLELELLRWPRDPRRRQALAAVVLVVLVALTASLVANPPDDALPFVLLLNPVLQIAVARWRTRRLQRAVALNGAPAT